VALPVRVIDEAAPTLGLVARRSPAYIPELESLRGIAILLVVTFHACLALRMTAKSASLPLAFVLAGHTGVSLFFVLSAFLLAPPFLAESGGGAKVRRRRYFARRALRILPLYYLAVLAGMIHTAASATDLPATLLGTAPFLWFSHWSATPMPHFSVPWWSLATEFQFYLALPFLPFLMRTRTGLAVLAGCALAYVALVVPLPPFGAGSGASRWALVHSLLGRAPLFALGVAAAWLVNVHGHDIRAALQKRWWIRYGGADLALVMILAALGLQLQWVLQISYSTAEVTWPYWHVLEGALWTAIVLLVLLAPLRAKFLVANPALGFLGLVSYSLYLVHFPVLTLGARAIAAHHPSLLSPWTWQAWAVATALLLASLGISCVTYRLIERPFLIRKARLTS
jgi:peptidoglycan/LPS O-acetylase OafA/YrhL